MLSDAVTFFLETPSESPTVRVAEIEAVAVQVPPVARQDESL